MQEILDANYSITKYLRPEVHEEIKAIEEKIILSYNMYEDVSEKHMILCTQDVLLMDQNNLTPQEFFEHNEERKQIGNLMNVIYNDVEKVIEKKLIDIVSTNVILSNHLTDFPFEQYLKPEIIPIVKSINQKVNQLKQISNEYSRIYQVIDNSSYTKEQEKKIKLISYIVKVNKEVFSSACYQERENLAKIIYENFK